MATFSLTDSLRTEYKALFDSCTINPARSAEVETLVNRLIANRARYEAVGGPLGIPWHFVAVIHNMEASQDFTKHLHNGDPLTARTRQVPAGRPKTGNPPFTWEASATDALTLDGFNGWTDWSVAGALFKLERFNGSGYRLYHPQVKSPYLWSFSNHYTKGKYVADGTWSDTATSAQCGAAVLLRRMAEKQVIGFTDEPLPARAAGPLVSRFAAAKPTDPAVIAAGMALQTWLNSFSGIVIRVDGWCGRGTSDAYKLVTGYYLPGDPKG